MTRHWSASHVGVASGEFAAAPSACWELVRRIYASERAIVLPGRSAGGPWVKVEPERARDLDLVLFAQGGIAVHVGVVAGEAGQMLHLPDREASAIERYDGGEFRPRLKGVYRHAALFGQPPHRAINPSREPLAVPDAVGIVGLPFIGTDRIELVAAPGDTLDALVRRLYPAATDDQLDRMVVHHVRAGSAARIERAAWEATVPAAGDGVTVVPLPGIFNLRTALTLAVSVAAIAASAIVPGGPIAAAAASAAILGAGGYAINRLAPPRQPGGGEAVETGASYSLQGFQNVANPNGAFAMLLGKCRVYPALLAQTYSEFSKTPPGGGSWRGDWVAGAAYASNDIVRVFVADGDGGVYLPFICIAPHVAVAATMPHFGASAATVWDAFDAAVGGGAGESDAQWLTGLFDLGYGRVVATNWRIGETPIEQFEGVEMEVREGTLADDPITLYPEQVVEDGQLGIELDNGRVTLPPQPAERRSARDSYKVALDLYFPEGLGTLRHADGSHQTAAVNITVEARRVGNVSWIEVVELHYEAFRSTPFGHTEEATLPTRDNQYDWRVTRTASVIEDDHDVVSDRVLWTAIRSFRPEPPLVFDRPIAKAAIRIRASKQLQGTLDRLNCDLQRICLDWDAGTQTWIERATSNPASIFRWLLQGLAKAVPCSDDEIDIEGLQRWHADCVALGLQYNRLHDMHAPLPQVLADVAEAGRASVRHDGRRWGVVVDRPLTIVMAHITPRNGWEIETQRPRVELPEGSKVAFLDQTHGYAPAERVVPFPGIVDPQLLEELPAPGKTHPDEIWRETRRRQLLATLRKRRYTASIGWDVMRIPRGALAILDDGRKAERVSARCRGSDGLVVELDEVVEQVEGESYEIRWRHLPEEDDEAEDDPLALSIVRPLVTVPGRRKAVVLAGSGIVPAAGALVIVAAPGDTGREVIVERIERGDNRTARLTLMDHAPEIEALVAADMPPAFDGRVGP